MIDERRPITLVICDPEGLSRIEDTHPDARIHTHIDTHKDTHTDTQVGQEREREREREGEREREREGEGEGEGEREGERGGGRERGVGGGRRDDEKQEECSRGANPLSLGGLRGGGGVGGGHALGAGGWVGGEWVAEFGGAGGPSRHRVGRGEWGGAGGHAMGRGEAMRGEGDESGRAPLFFFGKQHPRRDKMLGSAPAAWPGPYVAGWGQGTGTAACAYGGEAAELGQVPAY